MRRAAIAALAALLLLSACGCSALFDREVYVEEPYEAGSESVETWDAADAISNYAALRRALLRLVSERAESARLQFQNYDGTISRDISTACWEVKSSTALGAFAVDYISYDLSRIVSVYQAEIHITYKRSEHQMSALEDVETLSAMRGRIEQALREDETYLVMSLTAAGLTGDTVRGSLERAYYADPLACPVLPAAEVSLYPETGVSRIVEVNLDYGLDGETLAARRGELTAAVAEVTAAATGDGEEAAPDGKLVPEEETAPEEEPAPEEEAAAEEETVPAEEPVPPEEVSAEPADGTALSVQRLRTLCGLLAERCVPDEEAGSTAWDALTQGAADSEGIAMAAEACCQALGVECAVVFGRLDGETHAWNIVTLDGASYHIDFSRWAEAGEDEVFLMGDRDLWGLYWWDTSDVPASPLRYGAVEEESSDELFSEEPATAEPEAPEDAAESELPEAPEPAEPPVPADTPQN